MMKPHRRKRLYAILAILLGVSIAACLVIYALGQNMNVYLTPTQAVVDETPLGRSVRVGGLVKEGSFQRQPNSLMSSFVLTDGAHEVPVEFNGILPALFREGQGIIAQGKLNARGMLVAEQVLAKHDENYMPPT